MMTQRQPSLRGSLVASLLAAALVAPGAAAGAEETTVLRGHVLLPDFDADLRLTAGRVAALCDRRRGLGADGVLRVTTAGAAKTAGVLDRLPDGVSAGDWYMDYR
ncbi:MAG TPA: hypothetical protein PK867_03715, partial [Pirellulales bacterium]|nr:hypothetical protein [Pirellulales bacterium]